tara:strand:- start:1191 stop:2150 length:960 start_codon:yes stop_codon:yes gene_type:complete
VVTPNKLVYQPQTINVNNTLISQYIGDFLTQKFPIIKKTYNISNYNIINIKNGITVTTLYDFLKYTENNQHNLKFIMHLFNQKLTIISKDKNYRYISDLKDRDIYVYSKNSSEFYIMNILKNYYKFNLKIIYGDKYINDLISVLNNDTKIQNIAIFTTHPNQKIVNLINRYNYSMLEIDNIDMTYLRNLITNFKTDSIDSSIYYKYRTDMIDTILNPLVLICSENIDPLFIENLMAFIYKNFMLVKKTDDNRLSQIIKYFNLYDLFSSENNYYELHSGIINFYKKYGYISNKDLNICRKLVSIKSCSETDVRLNPYRLL